MGKDSDFETEIHFDAGTLLLDTDAETASILGKYLRFDERVDKYRAEASDYSLLVRMLHACGLSFRDHVRAYRELPDLTLYTRNRPMKHQQEAYEAWKRAKCRGLVVLPTGAGKTFFSFLAMAGVKRSTLVVVPTIDLLQQWATQLEKAFRRKVGMLGGGSRRIEDITVSTYDSAVLQMEFIGNRFGLVVFDECHHLPGPVNRFAASMCCAPYRLGLTATPECGEEGDEVLRRLIGETVCRVHIDELEGSILSPYVTRRLEVKLSEEEALQYREARKKYTGFLHTHGIRFSEPGAWGRFLALCARRSEGRDVLNAYFRQRAIARCSHAKIEVLWDIIRDNPDARILVFTADNDTAYAIGEQLCLPVLTHKTRAAERKDFLESFRNGDYPVLVTSKVLNEGVDVPEANIGIVVSGSASIREHVQRLGRILRAKEGKQARLYELVSEGTSEMSVSDRRRRNRAYRNSAAGPIRST